MRGRTGAAEHCDGMLIARRSLPLSRSLRRLAAEGTPEMMVLLVLSIALIRADPN